MWAEWYNKEDTQLIVQPTKDIDQFQPGWRSPVGSVFGPVSLSSPPTANLQNTDIKTPITFYINQLLKLCHSSTHTLSFLFFFVYLFIYYFGCVGSSLLRVGFLQLQQAGATLRCGAQASHSSGFSCCGAWALGRRASVVAARGLSSCGSQALQHRLSSCGERAQLLRGMWDLPGPGLKPMSPALASGFLTTAPPGKSPHSFFLIHTHKEHACFG